MDRQRYGASVGHSETHGPGTRSFRKAEIVVDPSPKSTRELQPLDSSLAL